MKSNFCYAAPAPVTIHAGSLFTVNFFRLFISFINFINHLLFLPFFCRFLKSYFGVLLSGKFKYIYEYFLNLFSLTNESFFLCFHVFGFLFVILFYNFTNFFFFLPIHIV